MAIVTPLVFTLVFAGIEFGRVLMAMHGLEEAAREGCRTAVLDDATLDDVEQAVADRLTTFGVSGYTLSTDPVALESACQWEPVLVRITVPYDDVSLMGGFFGTHEYDLGGTCSMRKEGMGS